MTARLRSRAGAAAAATTLILLSGAGPAPAPARAAGVASSAYVRAAHLSPDTAGVDVYLTAFRGGTQRLWLSGVGYGDVSAYRRLPPGLYAVSMRLHDAPSTTPPALTWSIRLGTGRAYTAAAIGSNAALHGVVFDDDLTAPAAGHALVRVVQASSRAGRVSVTAGGRVLTRGCAFGCTTRYVSVPSGRWAVRASSAAGGTAASATARVDAGSRQILSLVVLDAKAGGVVLHPLVDAAGASIAPTGAVPAGGGGAAATVVDRAVGGGSPPVPDLLAGGVAATASLAVLAAASLTVLARRRRRPAPCSRVWRCSACSPRRSPCWPRGPAATPPRAGAAR